MTSDDRVSFLDALRVSAILSVMLQHISAQNWSAVDVRSMEWQTLNTVNGLFRWGAPVFVMISGALMLGKDYTPKALFKKILRLAAAFLFWSVIYASIEKAYMGLTVKGTLLQIVSGHYHMWFLYMIVGLYLLIPLLRKIVESRRLTEYFLLLSLVFNFAIPQGITLLSLVSPTLSGVINTLLNKVYFHFALGFTGFFVLGYYLLNTVLTKKQRVGIYLLSLIGFVSTSLFTSLLSLRDGAPNSALHTYFSLNVLLECLGVFVFFQYTLRGMGEKVRNLMIRLSKCTFGAYLIHPMVLDFLRNVLDFDTLTFTPLLSVPVITLVVFAVSYMLSFAIRKIPKIGRMIV